MITQTYDPAVWQLVPKEPTEEMLHTKSDMRAAMRKALYLNMLAVAPQPELVNVEPFIYLIQQPAIRGGVFYMLATEDQTKRWSEIFPVYLHPDPEVTKLREQLAVAREAMQHYMDHGFTESSYYKVRDALATIGA